MTACCKHATKDDAYGRVSAECERDAHISARDREERRVLRHASIAQGWEVIVATVSTVVIFHYNNSREGYIIMS